MMTTILAFLVYWIILFAACFVVVEYGQRNLYDEVTPYHWAKVGAASLPLAILLTYAHSSIDSMFTEKIGWTIVQAIAWFLAFTFILRFHPLHAAVIGIVTFVLVAGTATMAVDSLNESINPVTKEKAPVFDPKQQPSLRKSAAAPPTTTLKTDEEKPEAPKP